MQPVDPTNILWDNKLLLQHEYIRVLNQLNVALQAIADQSAEIQVLKDKIARLKST